MHPTRIYLPSSTERYKHNSRSCCQAALNATNTIVNHEHKNSFSHAFKLSSILLFPASSGRCVLCSIFPGSQPDSFWIQRQDSAPVAANCVSTSAVQSSEKFSSMRFRQCSSTPVHQSEQLAQHMLQAVGAWRTTMRPSSISSGKCCSGIAHGEH
jgi:hypothetical protein